MARRLPRGLTRTKKGWRLTVEVRGQRWSKRYPLSISYDDVLEKLVDARKERKSKTPADPTGTLGADITRYLADFYKGHAGYAERERHLTLWKKALGADTWRSQIKRDDVARVISSWRSVGLAADTCNKRRTALLALFHALDGRGGSNPVREVPKLRAPAPLPRGLDYRVIEKALKKLPRRTRARLTVMAYTGIRPGQLMKLAPTDWDVARHLLTVPATAKGRGTKPYVIPLSEKAELALRALDALEAWGTFTTSPMARMWKAAAIAVGLPASTVPYDLRHSFGTAIYRKTGDLKATKELMGHAAIRMTERYTLAAVPARQKAALYATFPKKTRKAS